MSAAMQIESFEVFMLYNIQILCGSSVSSKGVIATVRQL